MWKGAHFSFAFINIHKQSTIHCKIPAKTLCHHEQAIPLERKQGTLQNNPKTSESSTAESDTQLSAKEHARHNQRSGK